MKDDLNKTSETTPILPLGRLALALSKAQKEIKPPLKTRHVDFTDKNGRRVKYSYSDLSDLIECIREPLSQNGLSVTHQLEFDTEGSYGMRTSLIHCSGDTIESFYPLPNPSSVRPQEMGSSITYARRYSLSSLIGVASEEDDDGEIAEKPQSKPQPQSLQKPTTQSESTPQEFKISLPQLNRLFAIAGKAGWGHDRIKAFMKQKWNIDSTKSLSHEQYEELIRICETRSTPHDG